MNNNPDINAQLKALRWKDRRRIRLRCFEEGLASWQFVVVLVGGWPCSFFATVALSDVGGWIAEHSVRISTFFYCMLVVAVLARQSDRFLPRALEEFQRHPDD